MKWVPMSRLPFLGSVAIVGRLLWIKNMINALFTIDNFVFK